MSATKTPAPWPEPERKPAAAPERPDNGPRPWLPDEPPLDRGGQTPTVKPAPPPALPVPPPPPAAPAAAPAAPAPADDRPLLDRVIDTIKTCYDPEIPLNIYDLSLIYGVDVDPAGNVHVKMTLTSPACPVAGSLPGEVQQKIAGVPGVKSAHVELVWDPPWDLSRLSDAARLALGMS